MLQVKSAFAGIGGGGFKVRAPGCKVHAASFTLQVFYEESTSLLQREA